MSLTSGSHLGPYEILGPLGAGGMGEVYRAHDTKLNRDVALKVVLAAVANDPDRLARFKREAHVLASLNHPNIAQIHGFEDSGPTHALVMELVEGPTLADRLSTGAIALDDALPIAKQIAEALEAAHEQGIIHRDLKPGNIKVRADGAVKVLDFGLAKALDHGSVNEASPNLAPTITSPLTLHGVILGTAAYMSPEQAKGRVVDRRADIWAFGCVLFEMLTGARAFNADDVTDTMVAVLSKEPDWPRLPASAVALRPLLTRCLKKDPRQRLQSIGDARIEIDGLIDHPAGPPTGAPSAARSTRRLSVAAAGYVAVAAAAAFFTWLTIRPAPPEAAPPSRFEIVSSPAHPLSIQGADRNIAISPDGRSIVYRAGPDAHLVVRDLDRLDVRVLEGSTSARAPFFSPDGRWVGFFDGAELKKISLGGGPPITICATPIPRGLSWGEDGNIVFSTQDTTKGLQRVFAGGGEPTVLTTPNSEKGEHHWYPSVLPGGRGVLFTITERMRTDRAQVAVLDSKTGQVKTLVRGGSQAEFVRTGHLVYAVGRTLSVVRFDLANLEVTSDPVTVVDDIALRPGISVRNYALSGTGTLVYVSESEAQSPRSLVWVDRTGRETPTGAPANNYSGPRLSPDASRIAVEIRDPLDDIHVFDLKRATLMRLASSPTSESWPIWTPDGLRVVFASQRDGANNLYAQAADGTGSVERLTTNVDPEVPAWIAPDGSGMLGAVISPKTAGDIGWFPFTGPVGSAGAREPSGSAAFERLVDTPFIDWMPDVSPNGRFVAYQSNRSGREEIYVQPLSRVQGGIWHVTRDGGTKPVWARDGGELYYLDRSGALIAVPVSTSGPTFSFGNGTKLFDAFSDGPYTPREYDTAPDGRFLVVKPQVTAERRAPSVVVVMNWFEELKTRLPTVQ